MKSVIKSYKELIVWQKSIELVKEIFLLTESFPKSELFGLTSQMRRAAIAIASNIAEGYGRQSKGEYIQFCSIAYGSSLELETQLIIATELGFFVPEDAKKAELLLSEVSRMLYTMVEKMKYLNAKP